MYSTRLVAAILGGPSKTRRMIRKALIVLSSEELISTEDHFRVQKDVPAMRGGGNPNYTQEEFEKEFAEHTKEGWNIYKLIPQYLLKKAFSRMNELAGLRGNTEEVLTDDEDAGLPRTHPNGRPLPIEANSNIRLGLKMHKKRKRGKAEARAFKCEPYDPSVFLGSTRCTALPAKPGPLGLTHFRTHDPKHPDCEICRTNKPQSAPHRRTSGAKKKAHTWDGWRKR